MPRIRKVKTAEERRETQTMQAERRARRPSRPKFMDPSARFHHYGELRMSKTLNDIRLLGNLSNQTIYKATPEEIEEMEKALDLAWASTKEKLLKAHCQGNPDTVRTINRFSFSHGQPEQHAQ